MASQNGYSTNVDATWTNSSTGTGIKGQLKEQKAKEDMKPIGMEGRETIPNRHGPKAKVGMSSNSYGLKSGTKPK